MGVSTPLPDLIDQWIADRRVRSRRGLSANSERGYRNDLAGFARRYAEVNGHSDELAPLDETDPWRRQNQQLKRIEPDVFTDAGLAAVFGDMVDSGASSASRARMLSALRGFTRWLITNGHLSSDPTLEFESPQPDKKLPVALTDEQLRAVLKAAANPESRLRAHWAARDVALVAVLAGCGIRSEELTELRIKNVQRSEPHRIRVHGKGAKERVIPLSAEVLTSIDHYTSERTNLLGKRPGTTERVFVRLNGQPLDNRSLQLLVTNWLAAAGVAPPPGEKVHLFRHTYGLAQVDRGTSLPELQALMGHENIATTSTYLRVSADGLHHTAKATAVNEILGEPDMLPK